MANAAGKRLPGQPAGARWAEGAGGPAPEQNDGATAAGVPSVAEGDGAGAGTDTLATAADKLREAAAAHDDDIAASVRPPA